MNKDPRTSIVHINEKPTTPCPTSRSIIQDDLPIPCPKCKKTSGDDWSQCKLDCPMPRSPYYNEHCQIDYKGYPRNIEQIRYDQLEPFISKINGWANFIQFLKDNIK